MFSVLLYTSSGGKKIGSPQTKEVQEKRNTSKNKWCSMIMLEQHNSYLLLEILIYLTPGMKLTAYQHLLFIAWKQLLLLYLSSCLLENSSVGSLSFSFCEKENGISCHCLLVVETCLTTVDFYGNAKGWSWLAYTSTICYGYNPFSSVFGVWLLEERFVRWKFHWPFSPMKSTDPCFSEKKRRKWL